MHSQIGAMAGQMQQRSRGWPGLRVADWTDTRDTLHMWTQIVGKIRLTHTPLINHWWNVSLYVSPRGLTTSSIPYRDGAFDIEFDLVEHLLRIRSSDGGNGGRSSSSSPMTSTSPAAT